MLFVTKMTGSVIVWKLAPIISLINYWQICILRQTKVKWFLSTFHLNWLLRKCHHFEFNFLRDCTWINYYQSLVWITLSKNWKWLLKKSYFYLLHFSSSNKVVAEYLGAWSLWNMKEMENVSIISSRNPC